MPPSQLQLYLQPMPDTKDYSNLFRAVALLMSRSRLRRLASYGRGCPHLGQNDPALPVFPHEQSHVLVTTGLMGTVGCAGWEGWAVVCSALSVETLLERRFAANIPLKSNESSDVESVDPSILLRMSCRSTAPRMNIMLHSKSRRLTTSKITNAKTAMTRLGYLLWRLISMQRT